MNKLPITEDLDFHYLLCLMPPLHDEPEFAWLPELYSTIGYRSLVDLCKFAGGETIKIPTIDDLITSIESLQWFYDVYISHKHTEDEIPWNVRTLVKKIYKTYKSELLDN